MIYPTILAFLIGVVTVLQSGLNRRMSMSEGLAAAVTMTALVSFMVALALFYAQKFGWIPLPEGLRSPHWFQLRKWWFIVPGFLGFMIIFGFPYAITSLGAARVFVIAVAGQCLAGMLWDYFVEHGDAPSLVKIVGVILTIVGAALTNF